MHTIKTLPIFGLQRKVLIVGGEFERFAEVVRTFDRNGFEVIFANSGSEGLRAARIERPSLVLCDLGLPEFSAIELCREIRKDTVTAPIPFITLSRRYHNRQNITEALAAGADDCLPHDAEVEYLFAKSLWQLHRIEVEAESREAIAAWEDRSRVLTQIVEQLVEQTAGHPGVRQSNPLFHQVLGSVAGLLSANRGSQLLSRSSEATAPQAAYDHSVIEFTM